jgi:ketosteroid isomerase-like protein
VSGDANSSGGGTLEASRRTTVEEFARLHAAGDAAGCAALVTDGAVMRSTLVDGVAEGRDAIQRLLEAGLARWAERSETVVAVVVGGDSAGIETTVAGRTTAGTDAELGVVVALGLEGDRIATLRLYADTTPFGGWAA